MVVYNRRQKTVGKVTNDVIRPTKYKNTLRKVIEPGRHSVMTSYPIETDKNFSGRWCYAHNLKARRARNYSHMKCFHDEINLRLLKPWVMAKGD